MNTCPCASLDQYLNLIPIKVPIMIITGTITPTIAVIWSKEYNYNSYEYNYNCICEYVSTYY